jgi:hypothetical protein
LSLFRGIIMYLFEDVQDVSEEIAVRITDCSRELFKMLLDPEELKNIHDGINDYGELFDEVKDELSDLVMTSINHAAMNILRISPLPKNNRGE